MKLNWKLPLMMMVLFFGLLAGCNSPEDNNDNDVNHENDQQDVENPSGTETNDDETDVEPGENGEESGEIDMEEEKGSDQEFDKDRGAD